MHPWMRTSLSARVGSTRQLCLPAARHANTRILRAASRLVSGLMSSLRSPLQWRRACTAWLATMHRPLGARRARCQTRRRATRPAAAGGEAAGAVLLPRPGVPAAAAGTGCAWDGMCRKPTQQDETARSCGLRYGAHNNRHLIPREYAGTMYRCGMGNSPKLMPQVPKDGAPSGTEEPRSMKASAVPGQPARARACGGGGASNTHRLRGYFLLLDPSLAQSSTRSAAAEAWSRNHVSEPAGR